MTASVHTAETLIPLMGAYARWTELTNRGWKFATDASEIEVGMTAVAYGHGKFRRGIVTKVGRVNARVEYVTPAGLDEHARHGWAVPVRGITAKIDSILILPAPAAAPAVEEPAVETVEEPAAPVVEEPAVEVEPETETVPLSELRDGDVVLSAVGEVTVSAEWRRNVQRLGAGPLSGNWKRLVTPARRGPDPAAVRQAAEQLQREMSSPAFAAALGRMMADGDDVRLPENPDARPVVTVQLPEPDLAGAVEVDLAAPAPTDWLSRAGRASLDELAAAQAERERQAQEEAEALAGTQYPTCSAWALAKLAEYPVTAGSRLVLYALAADADRGLNSPEGYNGTTLNRLADLTAMPRERAGAIANGVAELELIEESIGGPLEVTTYRLPARLLPYMRD